MKKILFIFTIISIPSILFSQKTKLKTVKFYNSKIIKEEFFVLKKNKNTKHGNYKKYHQNGILKEVGFFEKSKRIGEWKEYDKTGQLIRIKKFQNGKKLSDQKVGIWLKYHEKGQVITGFDFNKNEKIETQINISVKYPEPARKRGIEGVVKIEIKMNNNCEVEHLKLIKGIGYGCDKEALKKAKRIIELVQKYDTDRCKSMNFIMPIEFKLN